MAYPLRRAQEGRWIDDVFIERFWSTLKYEEAYLFAYTDLSEARTALDRYMRHYNGKRRYSSLGEQTPVEAYHQTTSNPLRYDPKVPG